MPLCRRCLLLPVAPLLFLAACGYVGDPLPPLINIPKPVTGLSAVERGARLIVQFELPTHTSEQVPIRTPLTVDLRLTSAPIVPFDIDRWANEARQISGGEVKDRTARFEIPVTGLAGRQVTVGARVTGANGKHSDWSALLSLPVVAPLETPAGVRTESTAAGVRVYWGGPQGRFRVLRRAPGETGFTLAAQVDDNEWTDPQTAFGQTYAYLVQRVADLGDGHVAESEPSAEVSATPADTFPPAAPTGVRASGSPASVELSWDRSREPDLAGYRIYRAAPGADFERLAETGETPAYSDRTAAPGTAYRYAVTAFDRNANESPRSAPIEAAR
jgi:hypothetical protein